MAKMAGREKSESPEGVKRLLSESSGSDFVFPGDEDSEVSGGMYFNKADELVPDIKTDEQSDFVFPENEGESVYGGAYFKGDELVEKKPSSIFSGNIKNVTSLNNEKADARYAEMEETLSALRPLEQQVLNKDKNKTDLKAELAKIDKKNLVGDKTTTLGKEILPEEPTDKFAEERNIGKNAAGFMNSFIELQNKRKLANKELAAFDEEALKFDTTTEFGKAAYNDIMRRKSAMESRYAAWEKTQYDNIGGAAYPASDPARAAKFDSLLQMGIPAPIVAKMEHEHTAIDMAAKRAARALRVPVSEVLDNLKKSSAIEFDETYNVYKPSVDLDDVLNELTGKPAFGRTRGSSGGSSSKVTDTSDRVGEISKIDSDIKSVEEMQDVPTTTKQAMLRDLQQKRSLITQDISEGKVNPSTLAGTVLDSKTGYNLAKEQGFATIDSNGFNASKPTNTIVIGSDKKAYVADLKNPSEVAGAPSWVTKDMKASDVIKKAQEIGYNFRTTPRGSLSKIFTLRFGEDTSKVEKPGILDYILPDGRETNKYKENDLKWLNNYIGATINKARATIKPDEQDDESASEFGAD